MESIPSSKCPACIAPTYLVSPINGKDRYNTESDDGTWGIWNNYLWHIYNSVKELEENEAADTVKMLKHSTDKHKNECAKVLLEKVNKYIAKGKKVLSGEVYNELSIYDWEEEIVTLKELKRMKNFLITAIDDGYTGHVQFVIDNEVKMWACKEIDSVDAIENDEDIMYLHA